MYLTDQTKTKMSLLHDGHFYEFIQTHIQHSRRRRASHDLSDQSHLTTDLEIAAIVLGVLFVLIIFFLIVYRFWKYYKKSRAPGKGLREDKTSTNDNTNFMDINKNMKRSKPSRTASFERRIHPGNKKMDNGFRTKDNKSGMNPSNTKRDDNDSHHNDEKHTEEMSKEQRKLMTRLTEKRGSIQSFNKQQLQTISEDTECEIV